MAKQSAFSKLVGGVKAMVPFRISGEWIRNEPLSNEPIAIIEHPYGIYQPISYFTLWAYFKDSPEVMACVTAIIEDILSDGWRLDGAKADVDKAEEFLQHNNAKSQLTAFLYDAFVTGDAYLYVNKMTDTDIRTRIEERFNGKQIKSSLISEAIAEIKQENPDILTTKAFRYLPSSTVRLDYDIHGTVHQYVQIVGSQWRWLRPEEIIHFKLMDLDGKAYGYTPIQTVLKEIDILTNIKDLAKYFFEKGGVPNFIWILKNETPQSANTKAFKKALQQYANLSNKHKSLVVCGEVEVQPVGKIDKDMEFRELARYVTQVIVSVFGVPANRIPGLLFEKGQKTGALNNEGYYRKIAHWQDILEDLLNSRLLKEYNVRLRFNRTYKQDEIREVQTAKMMMDAMIQGYNAGFINEQYVWDMLEVPEDRRGKPLPPGSTNAQFANQDNLNNHQLMTESDEKLAEDQSKQSVAVGNQIGRDRRTKAYK